MNIIKNIRASLACYFMRRQVITELNTYSDRELSDIGISRCDIPYIADQAVKYSGWKD